MVSHQNHAIGKMSMRLLEIGCSHISEHEEYGLLGCDTLYSSRELPVFSCNLLPPSSGCKMKTAFFSVMLVPVYQTHGVTSLKTMFLPWECCLYNSSHSSWLPWWFIPCCIVSQSMLWCSIAQVNTIFVPLIVVQLSRLVLSIVRHRFSVWYSLLGMLLFGSYFIVNWIFLWMLPARHMRAMNGKMPAFKKTISRTE